MTMKLSDQTDKLFTALTNFQAEPFKLEKDGKVSVKNKSGKFLYNFEYSTLGNILSTVRPLLTKHGLAVTQSVGGDGVRTIISHKSGQFMIGGALPVSLDGSNQDVGAAVTYMKRYSIAAALGLDADLDTDGGVSGDEQKEIKQQNNTSERDEPKPKQRSDTKKKETVKETNDQPESTDEYGDFIESCDNANDLIIWWKQVLDEGDEAQLKEKYEPQVFERLQNIQ